ncbi:MAG: GNAT family N-acetyltransferase [Candidatus Thorarchaeota archaeon]
MSDASIRIAPAELEDAETLTDICIRAFHSDIDFGTDGEGGPPGYDSVDWNGQRIVGKFVDYYKILLDDTIVGGFISGWRRTGYNVCERIYVDPETQREGIGSRTFELIWDRYPRAQRWTLGTPEWNTRTKNFYEKVGFTQIGFTYDVPDWRGRFYEKIVSSESPLQVTADLEEGMNRVVIDGEIRNLSSTREVRSRSGDPLQVAEAELVDDEGSISLVLWNEHIRQVNSDRVRVESGFVKRYRDKLQLSIGKWGLIISLIS